MATNQMYVILSVLEAEGIFGEARTANFRHSNDGQWVAPIPVQQIRRVIPDYEPAEQYTRAEINEILATDPNWVQMSEE